MDPIRGIPGTPSDIAQQVVGNAAMLDERKRDRPYPKRIPAAVTAYDPATGRYSWTEQTWDGNGNRIDKPNGMTGSPAYMPAVGYGDGTVLVGALLPVPVWLSPRLDAIDAATGKPLGLVFEFPVYCACVSGSGSGSGSGGGGGGDVVVACCPNPLPTVFHLTITAPTVPCIDGRALSLVWTEPFLAGGTWQVPAIVSFGCTPGDRYVFTLSCVEDDGFYRWILSVTQDLGTCMFDTPDGDFDQFVSATCHPFFASVSTTFGGHGFGSCPFTAEPVTLTITE